MDVVAAAPSTPGYMEALVAQLRLASTCPVVPPDDIGGRNWWMWLPKHTWHGDLQPPRTPGYKEPQVAQLRLPSTQEAPGCPFAPPNDISWSLANC